MPAILSVLLTGCTALPSNHDRQASRAIPPQQAEQTQLGETLSQLAQSFPGQSGIYPLADSHEAFAVRTLLADAAQKTLDIQYYIWRNDLTGTLMMHSLKQAADRGVRVRVLLDDSAGVGFDKILATLNAHENIEVRLFNPLAIRFPRWINYVVDFRRVNRRMHNKTFIADNQAAIIGGRNIGDEYFGAAQNFLFSDMDVVAVGPVVHDVSTDFDSYWNSESAYPVASLLPPAPPDALEKLRSRAVATTADPKARAFVDAMRQSNLVEELVNGNIDLVWAPVRMLSDDPAKVLGQASEENGVAAELGRILDQPTSHIELISSYFVPTRTGTRALVNLANQGIDIRILTNSLAATDVAAVHAGYAKHRKPLLKAGITLYEMRPQPDTSQPVNRTGKHKKPRKRRKAAFRTWRWGLGGVPSGYGPFGSANASLHAKTLSIDDQKVFVGSFNFDPRSARLNTELGFVIDSPELSRDITRTFMDQVPQTSYQVHLDDNNELYWTRHDNGQTMRFDTEPEASLWRRIWVGVLSAFPIEWML